MRNSRPRLRVPGLLGLGGSWIFGWRATPPPPTAFHSQSQRIQISNVLLGSPSPRRRACLPPPPEMTCHPSLRRFPWSPPSRRQTDRPSPSQRSRNRGSASRRRMGARADRTNSAKAGQLLRYSFDPPENPYDDVMRYLSSDFVDSVRACLSAGGMAATRESVEGMD